MFLSQICRFIGILPHVIQLKCWFLLLAGGRLRVYFNELPFSTPDGIIAQESFSIKQYGASLVEQPAVPKK
jgi:hypothetical protein